MKTHRGVIVLSLIAALSAVAYPVAQFIDGLLFIPLLVLPMSMLSYAVWLCSPIVLAVILFENKQSKRTVLLASGAIVFTLGAMLANFVFYEPWSAFLLGMKTRISTKVGIDSMRNFAHEVSHDPNGIVWDISVYDPRSELDESRREKLSLQYPFLSWGFGYGKVLIYDNIVSMSWGEGSQGVGALQ